MTEPILGLLLLPDPPQRLADLDDIRVALYPPLAAAISHLNKESASSCLEVALPIFRLVHVFRQHRSLFANVSVLLSNVYSLIATIYQQYNISITGPAHVDTRIVLVGDDHENPLVEPHKLPYGTVRFSVLSRSKRPWSHIFTVESENGQARHRAFKWLAQETRSGWSPKTIRIPGGLQFMFPNKVFDADESNNALPSSSSNQDTLIAIDAATFDFTDKFTLTMGLFLVDPLSASNHGDTSASEAHEDRTIFVVMREGKDKATIETQIDQQRKIIDFLRALFDFGQSGTTVTYASKADTFDGSLPLSRIQQKQRVQCVVIPDIHEKLYERTEPSIIVVAAKNTGIVERVNGRRRNKDLGELKVVELEDTKAVKLAELLN